MRLLKIMIALVMFGCGKVGDPLPPLIRIPEAVKDFSVEQRGYELHFSWTNSERNIDQSRSDDLERVVLSLGTEEVAFVPGSVAGEQGHLIYDVYEMVGSHLDFKLYSYTSKGRVSAASNTASITVVDVPGPILSLTGVVDQNRVRLLWEKPVRRVELAQAYRVYRSDVLLFERPIETMRFDDLAFQMGETYSYMVVAVSHARDGWVEGMPSDPVTIIATDGKPPSAPSGLVITPADTGAFLSWDTNSELDLAGYRVFRRIDPLGEFSELVELQSTTAFFDSDYKPGYQYAVSAIDDAGNEGGRSKPASW